MSSVWDGTMPRKSSSTSAVVSCHEKSGNLSLLREELRNYLETTGVSVYNFGERATNSKTTVKNFLEGSRIADKTADKIRRCMDTNPDGFTIKRAKDYGPPPDPVVLPAISRDACTRCGVRGELGCAHRKPLQIQKELKP